MPNDVAAYPADSFENMKRLAEPKQLPFPYVIDDTQEVARAFGAACTPDFFGFNADLELQYRGRTYRSAIRTRFLDRPATSSMRWCRSRRRLEV